MLRSKLSFLEKEIERHEVTKSEDDLTISDLKQNFSELGDKHASTLEYKRNLEETLNGKEKELEASRPILPLSWHHRDNPPFHSEKERE